MEDMENAMKMSKTVFSGSGTCSGCGAMLGLKLALQSLDNCVLVNSTGCLSFAGKNVKAPFVNVGLNANGVARGVANSLDEKNEEKKTTVLVFSGDGATRMNIQSMFSTKEDILYVCYNNYGFCEMGKQSLKKPLVNSLSYITKYAATASVAYPDDFVKKLQKAKAINGFKFIELLAPCPIEWGFDPSNTIEISRLAVETGFWPLYEIENGVVNLTKRPTRLEPVERYFELQKGFALSSEQIKTMQESINRSWRLLTDGRLL